MFEACSKAVPHNELRLIPHVGVQGNNRARGIFTKFENSVITNNIVYGSACMAHTQFTTIFSATFPLLAKQMQEGETDDSLHSILLFVQMSSLPFMATLPGNKEGSAQGPS